MPPARPNLRPLRKPTISGRGPDAPAAALILKRLSPLKHRNLNVLGATSFTAFVPREGLRPLHDPDAASWTMTVGTARWRTCLWTAYLTSTRPTGSGPVVIASHVVCHVEAPGWSWVRR